VPQKRQHLPTKGVRPQAEVSVVSDTLAKLLRKAAVGPTVRMEKGYHQRKDFCDIRDFY